MGVPRPKKQRSAWEIEENHEGFSPRFGDFEPSIRNKHSHLFRTRSRAFQQRLLGIRERIGKRSTSRTSGNYECRGCERDTDKRRNELADEFAGQLTGGIRNDDELRLDDAGGYHHGDQPPTDGFQPEARNPVSLPPTFDRFL
jgi:hypothetical protein